MPYKFREMSKFGPEMVLGVNPIATMDPKNKDHRKNLELTPEDTKVLVDFMNANQIPPNVQEAIKKVLSKVSFESKYKSFYDFYLNYWSILLIKFLKMYLESCYLFVINRLRDLIFHEDDSLRIAATAELKYYKGIADQGKIDKEIQRRSDSAKERKAWVDQMKKYQ